MMKILERFGSALPPWPAKAKAYAVAIASFIAFIWIVRSDAAHHFWLTLVDRRDAIAAPLLSVNASLLGFSITSFAVLLSVRKDEKFAKLQEFERASRQMWDALISASWTTGVGALTALLVIILKSPLLADWFQSVLTVSLFVTMSYVALTFVGVIAVIQALVSILRPDNVTKTNVAEQSRNGAFEALGPPGD